MDTLELESILNDRPEDKFLDYSYHSFIVWLNNRLKYKHKENTDITDKLTSLIENAAILPKKLAPDIIDKCCRKHYADFDMEKDDMSNWGYTEEEKHDIKKLVASIYETVIELQCNNE